jgi:hypothetical protein
LFYQGVVLCDVKYKAPKVVPRVTPVKLAQNGRVSDCPEGGLPSEYKSVAFARFDAKEYLAEFRPTVQDSALITRARATIAGGSVPGCCLAYDESSETFIQGTIFCTA